MGKFTVHIPLVTWRDGRPRYIPGAAQRRLGFKGQDLKYPDGRWFTIEECRAFAEQRQSDVDAARQATPKERRAKAGTGAITVGGLIETWFEQPRLNGIDVVEGRRRRRPLSANTVRFYKGMAKRLEELDDGLIWNSSAAAITTATIDGVIERIEVLHGLATARGVRATVSVAYNFGRSRKGFGLTFNPVKESEEQLPTPEPRVRYGSIAEMQHLVAAADSIDLPEVGDAILLGLWTGARQGDRLALGDERRTSDGIVFRQNKKHGQPLLIPEAPELAARLNAARIRRAGWGINYSHVIIDEERRRPFEDDSRYRKQYRKVRDAAVKGVWRDGVQVLRPMKSLADFRDQDLRDTAVTWLALARCTKAEIGAITGHSLKTIDEILSHYLGMHPELARSAIAKLVAWHDEKQGDAK